MNRRTAFKLLGGAAATALVSAGCADGSGGSTALTVGMPNGALSQNNNPFSATSSANSLGYRWLIYEPLAQVNLIDPDSAPTPWLAKEWKWAKDYKSVTLTVRDDAKWSDGKELTATDVAFTFTMVKDNDALNADAIPYKDVTEDGDKVTITFKSPQYVNQGKILGVPVVPKHKWSDIKKPSEDTVKEPVGSGPYSLKSWTSQVITLVPNKSYWGGKPPVPEVRYTSYNDNNAQTTALGNGECQWSYVFIPDYKKVFVNKDPEHNKLWFPSGLGIHALWINHTRKPFDSKAFRQAMNLVIDRKAIHKQGEAGLYPLVDSPTGLPRPVGDSFIVDKYAEATTKVDINKAKQLLEDAGFSVGKKLKDSDGKEVSFKLVAPSGWSDYLADLQIVSDNLSKLGIKTKVDTLTVDSWNSAMAEGDFDMSIHWTNTATTPWDIYSNLMDGSHYKKIGESAAWNFGRFKNDDATEALSAYAETEDEHTRVKALETLQTVMAEEIPAIPLVAGPIGANYNTTHWTGWPTKDNPYAMPQPTQPSASQIIMKLKPAS